MTTSLDMIRGRSNVVTLTNNSGGALVAGDVCVQDTSGDEYVTTTTSANSTLKVVIAAESIANGATGKFYASGYCPLVTPSASVTRGRYLFTHTVAKQAAESATYGAGAFGVILESGTTPSVWLFSATGQAVGGGNVTTTSAYASPPTPASGDVWFPNNSFYLLRYSGAAEVPWGPIYPMALPPAVSGLTWVNQGGASAVETNGGIAMIAPTSASDDHHCLVETAPATPWTFTVYVTSTMHGANYNNVGVCYRQSSDGKLVFFCNGTDGGLKLFNLKYSNPTTWSATVLALTSFQAYRWLRIADDGANRICSVSHDGVNFVQIHSVGRTDYLTADQYGIFINPSSTYALAATFIHWAIA